MKKKKWFKPGKHTGWKKTAKPSTRRSRLLRSTDKRLTMGKRYVQAGRKAQALSNVTKDKSTKVKSDQDAEYFFKKSRSESK